MKYTLVLILLTGCAALKSADVSTNLANVEAITTQNEAFLSKDTRADSVKKLDHDRNVEALALAKKMAEVK